MGFVALILDVIGNLCLVAAGILIGVQLFRDIPHYGMFLGAALVSHMAFSTMAVIVRDDGNRRAA